MKLSAKLILSFGTLACIIAFSNLFSIYQLSRVNHTSSVLTVEWIPSIIAIEEINTGFSDFRLFEVQHVYTTTADRMAEYEKMMNDTLKKNAELMRAYESIPMSEIGRKMYNEFNLIYKSYMEKHQEIEKLSRENRTEEAVDLLNGELREMYLRATAILVELVQRNQDGADAVSDSGNDIYSNASFSLTAVLVFSLIISIGVTIAIVRGTLRQLGKDPGQLALIAQRVTNGDYDIDDGSNKIGVYGNIVGMVSALQQNIEAAQQATEQATHESVRAQEAMKNAEAASEQAQAKTNAMLEAADRLEEVANVVSSASTELSAQIEQSDRGASEQAQRITEAASAMEEMNSTVLEVASNAGAASDASTSTRQKAEAGAHIVEQSVTHIRNVREHAITLKNDMLELNDQVQSISQIMTVISDIADQTNLLALNAAIEAARAGEAGRGFAVVADEVRKLAEKTMASTTDVGNAIRTIQQSAARSMEQVDDSVSAVEEATVLVNQSGEALREIVSMVDNTADQVRAIATAAEQQSATSEEITRTVAHVNTIASETARAMSEASKAVEDLSGQAQVLTRLIDAMKQN